MNKFVTYLALVILTAFAGVAGAAQTLNNPCVGLRTTNICVTPASLTMGAVTLSDSNVCLGSSISASVAAPTPVDGTVREDTLYANCPTEMGTPYTVTPLIVSEWWVASGPGGYTATGSGRSTTPPFTPTEAGTGRITFYCQWSGVYPCPDGTESNSTDFVVLKVDLDVDANYDGTISVYDPDDSLEVPQGGLVVLPDSTTTNRTEIILRQAQPTSWNGIVALTKSGGGNKIRVFTDPSGGTEITFNGTDNKFPNSALPKSLYVQGEIPSAALRDVSLRLTSEPGGCADEITLTVIKVDLDVDANYDGVISVDDPDDPLELTQGGLVLLPDADKTNRTKIILRQVEPAAWNETLTLAATTGGERIRVFTEPVGGIELPLIPGGWPFYKADLPQDLYVEGVSPSADTNDVLLTLTAVPITATTPDPRFSDKIALTVLKVDLDVDANYDGTISVDDPDDPIEVSQGGVVVVTNSAPTNRTEIILRKAQPASWNGDLVLTKTAGGEKITVFTAPVGGTAITFNGTDNKFANSALPKSLFVQGEIPSTTVRDVSLRLTSDPLGCLDEITLTVLKVELEPVNHLGGPPPDNACGIEQGQSSTYKLRLDPPDFPDNDIVWGNAGGSISFPASNKGRTVAIKGDALGVAKAQVTIGGFRGTKPTIEMEVLEKKTVEVFVYIITDGGTNDAATPAQVTALLAEVNQYYKQAAMEFVQQGAIEYIPNIDWMDISSDPNNTYQEFWDMCSTHFNTGGLELYFVRSIDGAWGLNGSPTNRAAGCAVKTGATGDVVAHEFGHACNLRDIYGAHEVPGTVPPTITSLPDDKVKEQWEPKDWNSGPGPEYYNAGLKQTKLIERLIMYGDVSGTERDFPRGTIYGVDKFGVLRQIEVGLEGMNRQPVHW